jgi:hypothetical protein
MWGDKNTELSFGDEENRRCEAFAELERGFSQVLVVDFIVLLFLDGAVLWFRSRNKTELAAS